MKNYAAALKDFNAAIAIHTSNADYYSKRADCLYGLHRWEKAVFAYEEAIDKISGVSGKEEALALMYFNKGLAQVQLKNWSAACKDFTESAKLGFLEAEDSYGKLCKGSKYDQ